MSGAASRNRGRTTEQMAVRWFRANGYEHAERTVRTGFRAAGRALEDHGDIDLSPGAIAAVKALRPASRMERAVPGWLAETEAQRIAAGADVALLVVRRDGTADVGEWWAWTTHGRLCCGVLDGPPCRLYVADAARLLRLAGYGSPLTEEAVTG